MTDNAELLDEEMVEDHTGETNISKYISRRSVPV